MLDPQDDLVYSHSGKELILFNFYQGLLGVQDTITTSFDIDNLLVDHCLDSFKRETVIAPFTVSEICLAILAMKNWDLVKPDHVHFMTNFYYSKVGLKRINKSYTVLIPKKIGVTKPEH